MNRASRRLSIVAIIILTIALTMWIAIRFYRGLSMANFVDDLLGVRAGMTVAEVDAVLGSYNALDDASKTRLNETQARGAQFYGELVYEHYGYMAWIEFKDGRVVAISNEADKREGAGK